MSVLLWVIIVTTVAGIGGTGLGGLIGAVFKKDSKKTVSLLLSFAAGVMLSIVCFDLILEALEKSNITLVISGVLLGYAVVFLLNNLIDRATNHEIIHIDDDHPKTADDLDELIHADHYIEHKKMNSSYQLFIGGIVMASAIALHNLPEGMVIGASYAHGSMQNLFRLNELAIAIVIGLHNIPEGMAVSVPLISGGMSKPKAVAITALTGSPTVIGAIIGYMLGVLSSEWMALSLSFASGAMLYVVFGELIPESILMWRSKLPAFVILVGMIVGILII